MAALMAVGTFPAWGQQSSPAALPASHATPVRTSFGDSATANEMTGTNSANGGGTVAAELELLKRRIAELESSLNRNAMADDDDDSDSMEAQKRIAALESTVEKNKEAIEEVDSLFDGVLHHSHKSPKMQFYGRIHVDYWAFPEVPATIFPLEGGNPQDRFNFRRLRIGIKGDLNDNMFYKYEGEFAGGEEPSYRDAFLGFRDLPFLNTVIIGNHKRPYGLDHWNSSRYNVFIERPFVIEAHNQDSRRMGISSNKYTEDLKHSWRVGYFFQELTQTKDGYKGDHYQGELAGRLANTVWYDECSGGRGYAHWGIAGSVGYPNGLDPVNNAARYRTRPEARSDGRWLDTGRIAGADTNMLLALEGVVNVGALQVVGEYQRSNVDRLAAFGPDLQFHGGYFYVSYFLTGEHIPWDRKTGQLGRMKPFENFFAVRDCDCNVRRGLGAWQVAVRYSYADFNDEDIIGGQASAWTFALNWHWNPYARMQFNWINGEINRAPLGSGDYDIIGVRWMVDF